MPGTYQEHGGVIPLSTPPIRRVRRRGTSADPNPPSCACSTLVGSAAECSTSVAELASTPSWLQAEDSRRSGSMLPQPPFVWPGRRRRDAPLMLVSKCGTHLTCLPLGAQFDTVLDCGLFHVFDDDDRARFVASLSGVVVPGGHYFLLCFSDKQPGDWGPRRVRQDELEHSFAVGWRIDSIEDTVLEITLGPEGARSWLVALTRV